MGAKVASIIFASLALISCYWLLIRYRIRYPIVWLIALLCCSAPFLFRMNMAKAPPLSIIYLILAIHFLFQKRYWPLLPLALVFTWTYDMFVLLVFAAFIWTGVIAWTERRFEWRPILWVTLGTVAGLAINPYFPHNLHLLYEHLKLKLTPSEFTTKVGSEWYPYDSWEFLGNSLVACIAMFVGYVAFEPSERSRVDRPLFLLIFSTALMIMTARWKRIAEYWPPFAIIFSAFSLQPWIAGARSSLTQLPTDVLRELQPFLDREGAATVDQETGHTTFFRNWALGVVVSCLCVALFFNLRATVKEIGTSESHEHYKAGLTWLRANVPAGERVFNTDWDDFPRLMYYDDTHTYISGLDPSYLFDQNPDLSRLYDRITLGQEDDPGPLIRDRFGARYVFSDNEHHDFFDKARESGWFDISYEDAECTIMHIRDSKVQQEQKEEDNGELFGDSPTGPIPTGPIPTVNRK